MESALATKLAELSRLRAMQTIDEGSNNNMGLDPLACVQQLRDPTRISVVKKRLRQPDVDEEWIGEFLQEGGLQAIWDVLEACGRHDPPKTTAQLNCVECIKAVLTRPTAMDLMLRAEEKFVHRLVLGECTQVMLFCYRTVDFSIQLWIFLLMMTVQW